MIFLWFFVPLGDIKKLEPEGCNEREEGREKDQGALRSDNDSEPANTMGSAGGGEGESVMWPDKVKLMQWTDLRGNPNGARLVFDVIQWPNR